MHRTDGSGHSGNMFVDEVPSVVEGTLVEQAWLNAVQEELVAMVTADGTALVKGSNAQLKTTLLAFFSGKRSENTCINGAMDFWQRGTSFASIGTSRTFAADRWYGKVSAGASELTLSQATGPDNFRYALKVQRAAAGTNANDFYAAQEIDRDLVRQLRGRKVSLTYWVKLGANFSQAGNPVARLIYGTGAETEILATGYTGQTNLLSSGQGNGTTWTRVGAVSGIDSAKTVTVPVNATTMAIQFLMTPQGTAGADDSFSITGVQLCAGPQEEEFSRAGGSVQAELALCQRFYEKSYPVTVAPGTAFQDGEVTCSCIGAAAGNYRNLNYVPYKVTKRIKATITLYPPDGVSAGQIGHVTAGDVGSGVATNQHNEHGFSPSFNSGSYAAGDYASFHYTADAEI